MGRAEVLKIDIEREEKSLLMMEFQRMAESSGEIPTHEYLLDKWRKSLETIGSFLIGFFLGFLSLFFLYGIITIMF